MLSIPMQIFRLFGAGKIPVAKDCLELTLPIQALIAPISIWIRSKTLNADFSVFQMARCLKLQLLFAFFSPFLSRLYQVLYIIVKLRIWAN